MMGLRTLYALGACITFGVCAISSPSFAEGAVSFKDKQITMIIGTPAGGGTDAVGRLVARFLTKYLPGNPNVIVHNQPGADGVTALNAMVMQGKLDGMTVTVGANTGVDPFNYRKPDISYDPSNFAYVGGVGRGGQFIVINKNAVSRLHDKTKPAVIMGSVGPFPRSGMQVTAWCIEYLRWNARWIGGYRGTPDIMLALEQGEIDMTATANFPDVEKLMREGRFTVAMQSGTLIDGKVTPRPEFSDIPLFPVEMQGKINDRIAQEAYNYWLAINTIDKWVALLAKTPANIIAVYRDAFVKMAKDPEFLDRGKKISEDVRPMSVEDVVSLVKTLTATTPEAIGYMTTLLRKQGLRIAE
jgi:tripartite-type tricarboxylate transporter receptor subunit TctC